MKNIIAMLLVAVLALGMAACGATPAATEATTTAPAETTVDTTPVETTTAVEDTTPVETTEGTVVAAENTASKVLNAIWANYPEDYKGMFMGGDYNGPVDGNPGVVTAEDFMMGTLWVPEAEIANIAETASVLHMNGNTFTGAAYVLAEGVDVAAFAETMKTTLKNNQWMCGTPEQLLIANVGEALVVVYGSVDAVTPFQEAMTAVYADAVIIASEPVID